MPLMECAHCTLAVPAGLLEPGADKQFCCHGCRAAHTIIMGHGLEQYYRLGERTREPTVTGDKTVRYAEFDREAFIQGHTVLHDDGQRSVVLGIEGLHCAACIWLLERLDRVVPGVVEARVNWRRATLEVRWVTSAVSLSTIAEGIAGLGYRPHPLRRDDRAEARRSADRQRTVAIAVAFAAAGNNMLIAASLYLGMFSSMDAGIEQLLRWASCFVGLVSLTWPGRVFFRGAWSALRSRTPHMDLPVALALAVGGVAGTINTIRGTGELYFDTLCVLVFLLLVGRAIQLRQQREAAATLDVMRRITPQTAHRRVGDAFVEVPATVLEPGDVVRVAADEVIPGDGTILSGETRVDVSVLTGEAAPLAVGPGAEVAAGTLNLGRHIIVRLDAVGEQTQMGRILELIESSAESRPAIVALADRIGARFVLAIVAASVATLGAWLIMEPSHAVDHAVALLIVACPCALALATPLTLSVAIARAAQRKVLIKGGDVLQRLSRPGMVWLDKTGTVTEGRMAVVSWRNVGAVAPAALAEWVAAVEAQCVHPVAQALAANPRAQTGDDYKIENVQHDVHGGVTATVEGHEIAIGNAPFVRAHLRAPLEADVERVAASILASFASPIYVCVDGAVAAVAGVDDPLRADARDAVAGLRDRGWAVGILSGDHPDVVAHTASVLGLSPSMCHGGLLPQDKVAFVARSAENGATSVMVGDGVNDAAALAAASVGIATHRGAEASLRAAPVYLGRPGLGGVVELLDMGQTTMRAIVRNFGVSLAYNAVAVVLAAAGLIGPLVAAVLMPISSLTVVSLALTLRFRQSA